MHKAPNSRTLPWGQAPHGLTAVHTLRFTDSVLRSGRSIGLRFPSQEALSRAARVSWVHFHMLGSATLGFPFRSFCFLLFPSPSFPPSLPSCLLYVASLLPLPFLFSSLSVPPSSFKFMHHFFLKIAFIWCALVRVLVLWRACRGQRTIPQQVLFFHHGALGWNLGHQFGSKYFYLFCHLSRPRFLSWD